MKVYDKKLEGYFGLDIGMSSPDEDAVQYSLATEWSEIKTTERNIKNKSKVAIINGVGVWYEFSEDYYFFTVETK